MVTQGYCLRDYRKHDPGLDQGDSRGWQKEEQGRQGPTLLEQDVVLRQAQSYQGRKMNKWQGLTSQWPETEVSSLQFLWVSRDSANLFTYLTLTAYLLCACAVPRALKMLTHFILTML